MTRNELLHFFPDAEQEGGKRRVLRVVKQMDFPTLYKLYKKSTALRKLCNAIMDYRKEHVREYASFIPEEERCIPAARHALLSGNAGEFERMFRLFKGMKPYCIQPGLESETFWSGVLGTNWLGAGYVPAGEAQRDIQFLVANRYSLFPTPESAKINPRHLPVALRVGYSILKKGEAVFPRSKAKGAVLDDTMTQACRNLLDGKWQLSYRYFSAVFRGNVDLVTLVREMHAAQLLLLACIMAVRARANVHQIETWVASAREIMIDMIPAACEDEREEVGRFFDMIRFWDAMANRRSKPHAIPAGLKGALSHLPLALAAPAIHLKSSISVDWNSLADKVEELYNGGMTLLAVYGASGLLTLPELGIPQRARMAALIQHDTIAPLYNGLEDDENENRLVALMRHAYGPSTRRLYWDIHTDAAGGITDIFPQLVENKLQAVGVRLSVKDVMHSSVQNCQSQCDAAVAAFVSANETDKGLPEYHHHIPLYSLVLPGHPRLRLVHERYHRPVQMVTRLPILGVSCAGNTLHFNLDWRQFSCIEEEAEEGVVSIPQYSPHMQLPVEFLLSGKAEINTDDLEETRWVLACLSEHFRLEGAIPQALLEPERSICVPFIKVSSSGRRFSLRIDHMEGLAYDTAPGEGQRVMMLTNAEGERVCVVRDMEAEREAAQRFRERCLKFDTVHQVAASEWMVEDDEVFRFLQEFEKYEMPVLWQTIEGDSVLQDVRHIPIYITATGQGQEWFEIGGELEVDEDEVYTLSELLESYHERRGTFLPVRYNQHLHISPFQSKQLQCLSDILQKNDEDQYILPVACVPAFVTQWEGELPEPLLRRLDMMRECDTATIPPDLQATLREYQLAGYRWLLSRVRSGVGACLADDMGLGKTVQVLSLLLERASAGPSLVVVPLSLCSNWVSEAAKFAPGLRMLTNEMLSKDTALKAGDVVVVSYGRLTSQEDYFCSRTWNTVVLDEAQAIKNSNSHRARVVYKLSASARVCLTGTPVENSLTDLWSIMNFLNPGLLGARSRYVRPDRALIEKVRRMVAPLVLRRTKSDVLPQLPPLTEMQVGIELSLEERALYESCRRRALVRLEKDNSSACVLAEFTSLRRACCHGRLVLPTFRGGSSKLRVMLDMLQELRRSGHKVLVFSQFTDVLDLAQDMLLEAEFATLRLDGSTPAKKRDAQVRSFNSGVADVFLISLRAGAFGLNLTAADYVLLLDPWWNPAVEAQAAGRSHRIGQHKPVTVCRLVATDTVEEKVIRMHQNKQQLADSVISEGALPLDTLRRILYEG